MRSLKMLAIFAALLVPSRSAELLSPAQQNALVKKYCATCHTDAARSGGLSLEHYDAAEKNPALAAMMLSKLHNGAMGAAGIGHPDKAMGDAWVAATEKQALGAEDWTVIRNEVLSASIVRSAGTAEVYRLILSCDTRSRKGEARLTWSPAPQKNRLFFVSADGKPEVQYQLADGEAVAATVLVLNAPLAEYTLAVRYLFSRDQVVFPLSELDQDTRRELSACFPDRP